jgi:hypothetical protein
MRHATRIKLGFLTVLVLAALAGAPPFAARPAYATNCTRTYCDQLCSWPRTHPLPQPLARRVRDSASPARRYRG